MWSFEALPRGDYPVEGALLLDQKVRHRNKRDFAANLTEKCLSPVKSICPGGRNWEVYKRLKGWPGPGGKGKTPLLGDIKYDVLVCTYSYYVCQKSMCVR